MHGNASGRTDDIAPTCPAGAPEPPAASPLAGKSKTVVPSPTLAVEHVAVPSLGGWPIMVIAAPGLVVAHPHPGVVFASRQQSGPGRATSTDPAVVPPTSGARPSAESLHACRDAPLVWCSTGAKPSLSAAKPKRSGVGKRRQRYRPVTAP